MYQKSGYSYDQEKFLDNLVQAKQVIVEKLKELHNREQRQSDIEDWIVDYSVDLKDVVKYNGFKDFYRIEKLSGNYYKIATPKLSNKQDLVRFIKENQGFKPIDTIILNSSYREAAADIQSLEKEGRLQVQPLTGSKDMHTYIWKEKIFESKVELDYFRDWISKDYEDCTARTRLKIEHENFKLEKAQTTKIKEQKKLQVVNWWIFPDGLPQEFRNL